MVKVITNTDDLERSRGIIKVAGEGYALASRGSRWVASFLDGILGLLLFGGVWALRSLSADLSLRKESTFGLDLIAFGLDLIAAGLTLGMMYIDLFWDGSTKGQTWGKALMGIRVINSHNGNPCSYARSFLRNVVSWIPLIGLIDILFIYGEKRQRLGERLAETHVVKGRTIAIQVDDNRSLGSTLETAFVFLFLAILFFALRHCHQ